MKQAKKASNASPHQEYFSINALNWSSLKLMADSPRMYRYRQDHPRPDSKTFAMGRAIHCAVLEPEEFGERYIEQPPDVNRRSNAGKAWLAEAIERGVEVLTAAQSETVIECAEAVAQHGPAAKLLEGTRREETLLWTDQATGVPCKARADALDSARMIDLKSTSDMAWFDRDFAKFMYHGQLAWYLDGAIACGACSPDAEPYIVAVESVPPYDVAAITLRPYVLEAGRVLYRRLLDTWVTCRDADVWPGRHPTTYEIDLPKWAPGMEDQNEEEIF